MTHESNDHEFINAAVAGNYCGAEAAGRAGLRGFLLSAVGGGLCEGCGRGLTAIMRS
jgi:hypothetical protein